LLFFQVYCFTARVETLLFPDRAVHHLLKFFPALDALNVSILAQLRVLAVELRVASFKQVTFGVEETRISVRVDVAIEVAHTKKHVWSPLQTMLAVEDQNCPLRQVAIDRR
jgi:hypothetical protein